MEFMSRRPAVATSAILCAGLATGAAVARADVNVVELPVTSIESGLSAGTFTDKALMQSYLNRINMYNPLYNAFTWLNPDALAQATADDAIIAANGGVLPANEPMFGVPVVIKDSMNVAGVRTTGGYSGFTAENGGADMIPLTDAPIVARLKAAGAIILGKTNLPAFAKSAATANTSYLGPTLNSYYSTINIVPGGSSSGTATSVSASFAPIGTAEETGGSIENPAGAQSLIGVKTTFGLVPTSGGIPLNGSTRDVFGVNARNVTDAANFLSVIAGYDPSDPKTSASNGHIPAAGYGAGLSTTSLQGKRFGLFSPAFKNVTLSSETQSLYNKDVQILQGMGATVVTDPFSDPALTTAFNTLATAPITSSAGTFSFSAYSGVNEPYDLQQWMSTLDPSKSPTTVAAFKAKTGLDLLAQSSAGGPLLGAYSSTPNLATAVTDPTVSQDAMVAAFMQGRAQMLAAFEKVMKDYNLDGLFFPQEFKEPGALIGGSYSNTTVSEVNLMGTPLVDLPGGYYADGAPFSVAFLGDQWSEQSLLDYAYAFEQGTEFRVAPTLVTPEPASNGVLALGAALLLSRRRRPK
jgi:Asp-tRNA(Asn)/Glu-tRNA(Gln) amidotransferase A subunit family amidase